MRINLKNKEEIEKILNEVQSDRMLRKVDYSDICSTARTAEEELEKIGLVKSQMKGVKFTYNRAETFTSTYGMPPKATCFSVEHGRNDWFSVNVSRDTATKRSRIYLTNEQKEYLLQKINNKMSNFTFHV